MQEQAINSREQQLLVENEYLKKLLSQKDQKISYCEHHITWLTERISGLNRSQFGDKSEKWINNENGQLTFFNEAEVEAAKEKSDDSDAKETTVAEHKRKTRGHRKALPEHLSREVVKIELPESELITETGEKLKIIGWEVSEKLKYTPGTFSIIEYHRAKYGVDSGDYVKTAAPLPSLVPKGIATPELLAAILVMKFADGLPLYRIEEIFKRQEISLSRGTMGRWVVSLKQWLMPIRNALQEHLSNTYCLSCDETRMQVLKEKGRRAQDDSWMIVRCNPYDEIKVALFEYSTSRSGKTMKELMEGYSGKFQCDGLNVYDGLVEVDRFGCNMHSRRKFEQAAKDGAKEGRGIASQVMTIYSKIYDHEEEIKDLEPEAKIQRRNEVQRPLYEEIKSLVDDNRKKVPNKSKLGDALRYFENEYERLTKYLNDGRIGPDNGHVERINKQFAIGRKAWLFADTPDGAEASAMMYSIVISAKLNKVDPHKALARLLTELPQAKTIEDYERLTEYLLVNMAS